MPRFNGTGPEGKGPMTGHGGGYCVVDVSERGVRGLGLFGRGRGLGLGRRVSGGRGRGMGFGRAVGRGRWTR